MAEPEFSGLGESDKHGWDTHPSKTLKPIMNHDPPVLEGKSRSGYLYP